MNSEDSPQLLVSVRDETEAIDALCGGVDWLDLKEPSAGALGAVKGSVAARIVQTVAGRCPISAALGELIDWPMSGSHELLGISDIGVVKLGLSDCATLKDWTKHWQDAFRSALHAGKHLAAVIYADWPAARSPMPQEVINCAQSVGCRYLLVDTFLKNDQSTLEILSLGELKKILRYAHRGEMTTVLAGNLRIRNLSSIVKLPVNLVAVRGAVCQGLRTTQVESGLVREFRTSLANAVSEKNQLAALSRSRKEIFLDSGTK